MKKEKKIKNSTDPVSISCTKKILDQMTNSICKIKTKGANATGFFCRTQLEANENIDFLMTNYHVLDEQFYNENKEINLLLNDDTEALVIDLTFKRRKYFNKEYDIALIELKEIDKVKNYLELDDNLFKGNENVFYEEKSIYLMGYPNGKKACVSYGLLTNINESNITHTCSTENGSSGSPILNLENNKVIGIHKEGSVIYNFNLGTFLKNPLDDFYEKNGLKKKVKKNDEENYKKNNISNLQLIPNKNIKEDKSIKKSNNNTNIDKNIKLDSTVIWIDKNIDNEENAKFIEKLESTFGLNIGLFKDINNALHYIQTLHFKETKVIISGSFYKEFLEKFKEKIKYLCIAPKVIVFTGNSQKFFKYNKEYQNKENIFYTFGGVATTFEEIIRFLKNENQIDKKIEPQKFLEKEPLVQLNKLEESEYMFYFLDSKEKMSLPILFESLLDKTSIDNLENYTLFLFNTYSNKNKDIKLLLGSIIYMKNIPLEILSKYYARLINIESDFYKDLGKDLRLGIINKYLPLIRTLYDGVKLKSLPLTGEHILYRASPISFDEIKKIIYLIKNGIKNPPLIIFSKTFLSFTKDKRIANSFLEHALKFNYDNKKITKALFILEKDDNLNKNYFTHVDPKEISIFPNEKEVLFFPFSAFEIKEIKEAKLHDEIIYEIKLLYLGKYSIKK